jgi:hypothetical protein
VDGPDVWQLICGRRKRWPARSGGSTVDRL